MSVVVDSSPLIFLAAISRFELLRLYAVVQDCVREEKCDEQFARES